MAIVEHDYNGNRGAKLNHFTCNTTPIAPGGKFLYMTAFMGPPAKKRKLAPAVEEISFDSTARHDFLTGFHKRKLQRQKHAQEKAEQRARQEKIDARKKLREARKVELARHVQAVNDMLRPSEPQTEDSSESETEGVAENKELEGPEDVQPRRVDHEAEYIDEDKYTTVTVETVDVSREGLSTAKPSEDVELNVSDAESQGVINGIPAEPSDKSKAMRKSWSKVRPSDKPRRPKKKRNFRYEGKQERKLNRAKEKIKNSKQAQARKAG